jgi:hypothetical protein
VADRNFKAFILAFFWGGVLCVTAALCALFLSTTDGFLWAGFFAAYAAILGGFSLVFGWSSLSESRQGTAFFDKIKGGAGTPLSFCAFLESFGSVWWEKLTPVQRTSTFLAWPGIAWDSEDIPL